MKDGLYEGTYNHKGYFFVCKNNKTTIWARSKGVALNAPVAGAPTVAQQQTAKWISYIYPSDGIWKNKWCFFALKGNKFTGAFDSVEGVNGAVNKGLFPYLLTQKNTNDIFEYVSPLPASRVKLISGEYILTLEPPKSDFDIYVKQFGFFNEVYVEDVIRFARENYPCWESWLLKHGIPFKEEEIGVGDIVEVVDDGKRYPSGAILAKELGAKRFVVNNHHKIGEDNGKKGRVIAIGAEKIALVDVISEEILVGIKGLRRIR